MSNSDCTDTLTDANLIVPVIPCDDIKNMDKWKAFAGQMSTLGKSNDLRRIVKQCLCQNSVACANKCQFYHDSQQIITNDECRKCIFSNSPCGKFEAGIGSINQLAKYTGGTSKVDVQHVASMVQNICNISVSPDDAQRITDVINNEPSQSDSPSSSSGSSGLPTIWIWVLVAIGILCLLILGLALWSKRGRLSRQASPLKRLSARK